ncbi:Gfo/Idh/MocA family protein [Vibrio hangzhouensis]|uniref:Oxidoreductase family, NAD-binding Rossmann fold n=1 Tax=Vibrio hangzhouensis TaxID=462991 RepID=A0A1H5XPT3_9VIBR|nr:Gfo/Idh/MocA family oxidoreductase [Vibrio hangzhouensis]SEG13495.1 Oxidoreductase family, NAD-binding Rossmann fold [Vibrio hangzhouensis]
MLQKARWGIAGLGKIARRFVIDLTQHVEHGELVAVAARDEQRAEQFAKEFAGCASYGSYQALAEDPNVDVVYVATLHPYHRSMVELFLNAGKHVLVEKPAFTNVNDWDEMSQLAVRKGLILAEAMKSVTFPAYLQLKRFIIDNGIQLSSLEAAFGNWHQYDENYQIFNPSQSGGATLDVGVYALWLYADLCQTQSDANWFPMATFAHDNPQSQVDEYAQFQIEGRFSARLAASISRDLPRSAVIRGTDFEAVIAEKWWNPKRIEVTYQGEKTVFAPNALGGGFEHEIEHVSQLVQRGATDSILLSHTTSRKVIEVMEGSLVAAGYGYLTK